MADSSRDQPRLLAATLFITAGVVALWEGRTLEVGELASMGPGYMPRVLALMLIAIGVLAGARGWLGTAQPLSQTRLRPLLAVFAAVAGFAGLLALKGGLVLAAAWLLAVASLATPQWRAKEVLRSAAFLIPMTVLIFVAGLGLQIKVWPW
jgi:Tripartite tricarboxylate transporter TctB family